MDRKNVGRFGYQPMVCAAILISAPMAITGCSTSPTPTTGTVAVSNQPTSTVPAGGPLVNGQDIFLTATDASGVPVIAQGFAMMTRAFACADCHGIQGKGGTVYMMMALYDVPNITWPALTVLPRRTNTTIPQTNNPRTMTPIRGMIHPMLPNPHP